MQVRLVPDDVNADGWRFTISMDGSAVGVVVLALHGADASGSIDVIIDPAAELAALDASEVAAIASQHATAVAQRMGIVSITGDIRPVTPLSTLATN